MATTTKTKPKTNDEGAQNNSNHDQLYWTRTLGFKQRSLLQSGSSVPRGTNSTKEN